MSTDNALILKKAKETQFAKEALGYFTPKDQKQNLQNLINFLSSSLSLPEFLTDLRQSILIDFFIYNLEFCRKMGYTPEKTAALLYTFEAARQKAVEKLNDDIQNYEKLENFFENSRRKEVKEEFKTAILEFSIEKMEVIPLDTDQQNVLNTKRSRVAELEESAALAAAKKSKKTKKQLDDEAEELKNLLVEVKNLEDLASAPRLRAALFSEDDVREISSYFLQVFFEKIKMFYYVFNEERQTEGYSYSNFQREPAGASEFIPELQYFMERNDWEAKMKKEQEEREKIEEERKIAAKAERERREKEDKEKFERLEKEKAENAGK